LLYYKIEGVPSIFVNDKVFAKKQGLDFNEILDDTNEKLINSNEVILSNPVFV